jgi:hypothetical protein
MPEEPTGTPPPTGDPQVETPAPTGQAPAAAQSQPNPADLQKQIDDLRKQNQEAQQSARYHQSQADRLRAALGAPNQPNQEQQYDQFVSQIAAKHKVDANDAKRLIPFIQELQMPMAQELQMLRAQSQNNVSLSPAMQAAFTQRPDLLSDPDIYMQTEAQLRQAIAASPQPIPAEQLQGMAIYTAGGLSAMKPQTQVTPQQPTRPHPLNFSSMTGIPQGVATPRAAAPAANATDGQLALRAQLEKRMNEAKGGRK